MMSLIQRAVTAAACWCVMAGMVALPLLGARSARAAEPKYPETTDGLQKQVEDVFAALKGGDKDKASALIKAMVLPEHEAWFTKTFGAEKGKALSEEYAKQVETFEKDITKMFAARIKDGRTFASAVKIEGGEDQNATGAQKSAIGAMQQKAALYTVRLGDKPGGDGFSIWSWVYQDGQFRLVGKMRALRPAAS
jgi:hypothetical protein